MGAPAARAPRIAILGLNPHAGDGGTLGSEDKERIVTRARYDMKAARQRALDAASLDDPTG